MIFTTSAFSHPGRVRPANEDAYCLGHAAAAHQNGIGGLAPDRFGSADHEFREFGWLGAVADGMGGYAGGALAARTTVEALVANWYGEVHAGMSASELAGALQACFDRTLKTLRHTLEGAGYLHAGCTLAGVALFPPDVALVFHCGDARVMRESAGYVRLLTADHTPLTAPVAAGILDEAGAAHSPLASMVSRSLGLRGDARLEINREVRFESGDTFLICSDGFQGLGRGIALAELRQLLGQGEASAEFLVREAVERDGRDNVTVVTVRVEKGSD